MTDLEYIAHNLSAEDILCSIAEEASELAKAALKLRRAFTGTNPTPVSEQEAAKNLCEEACDVTIALDIWDLKSGYSLDEQLMLHRTNPSKIKRWVQRIKESKSHD